MIKKIYKYCEWGITVRLLTFSEELIEPSFIFWLPRLLGSL